MHSILLAYTFFNFLYYPNVQYKYSLKTLKMIEFHPKHGEKSGTKYAVIFKSRNIYFPYTSMYVKLSPSTEIMLYNFFEPTMNKIQV